MTQSYQPTIITLILEDIHPGEIFTLLEGNYDTMITPVDEEETMYEVLVSHQESQQEIDLNFEDCD